LILSRNKTNFNGDVSNVGHGNYNKSTVQHQVSRSSITESNPMINFNFVKPKSSRRSFDAKSNSTKQNDRRNDPTSKTTMFGTRSQPQSQRAAFIKDIVRDHSVEIGSIKHSLSIPFAEKQCSIPSQSEDHPG
jgi:hypothetical protein